MSLSFLEGCNGLLLVGLWQHSILKQLQQLFLDYPFHNLLHRQVFGIFSLIFQSDSPELLQHLLQECRLVDWLIKAPKEVPLEGGSIIEFLLDMMKQALWSVRIFKLYPCCVIPALHRCKQDLYLSILAYNKQHHMNNESIE